MSTQLPGPNYHCREVILLFFPIKILLFFPSEVILLACQMPSFLLTRLLSKTSLGFSPPKDLFKLNIDMHGPGPFLAQEPGVYCGFSSVHYGDDDQCVGGFRSVISAPWGRGLQDSQRRAV